MSDAQKRTWSDPVVALGVWKYYADVGGADKNTMIRIVTWLLGFSAAIIGFYAKDELKAPLAPTLLLVIGIVISIVAAFTALLYGGYAGWNWSIADRIAQTYDWTEQKPTYNPFADAKIGWMSAVPFLLAKPCENRLAPVFWLFFFASLVSLGVHVMLFCHAIGKDCLG